MLRAERLEAAAAAGMRIRRIVEIAQHELAIIQRMPLPVWPGARAGKREGGRESRRQQVCNWPVAHQISRLCAMSGEWRNKLIAGDCREVLQAAPDASVELIVTSPPYADQRNQTYGGVPIDQYVEWFVPITQQLHRVLKPAGSFVLNIKERVANGERHTYVLELILAMRKQGWLWTEEYLWHKKNCHPGKWPNRFRDA